MVPTTALIAWPFISVLLFSALDARRGLILSVVIGYLFLPSGITLDLPLVAYGKDVAISFGLLLAYALLHGRMKPEASDPDPKTRLLFVLMIGLMILKFVGPFLVYLTNREGLSFGPTFLPGLGLQEALVLALRNVIAAVPFLFGWRLLARGEDQGQILRYLVIWMLGYSLLALFEIRMSPQLNNWIYGYFPHSWLQHVRGGGFRPLVFLSHGLVLGMFILWAILASAAKSREATGTQWFFYLAATLWLLGVLLISRNFGASMLAILFLPVALFFRPASQIRISAIFAIIFLLYPMVRQAEVLPIDRLTSAIRSVSEERALSFEVRLKNEQQLLERAAQKPLFGWGLYSRNRIFNENGRDITLADGIWVIMLGAQGWVGYIALFGPLALPMLWLVRVRKRRKIPPATVGITVMLAANFVDMIPNSSMNPFGMLIAGALTGFLLKMPKEATEPEQERELPVRKLQYTRFPNGAGATARPSAGARFARQSDTAAKQPGPAPRRGRAPRR